MPVYKFNQKTEIKEVHTTISIQIVEIEDGRRVLNLVNPEEVPLDVIKDMLETVSSLITEYITHGN